MLNRWIGDIALLIRAKIEITLGLIVGATAIVIALLTAFAFICVAGHNWLSLRFGAPLASLAMAGIFLLFAIIGVAGCKVSRQRTKERAILARATRAYGSSRLIDPKTLSVALQTGRALGWRRFLAIVLIGIVSVQFGREIRQRVSDR